MSVWFYQGDGTDLFRAGDSNKLDDMLLSMSDERHAYVIEAGKVQELIAKRKELKIPPDVLKVLQQWVAGKESNELLDFYIE